MFGQIPETSFDLHFRVLGIPVRIHPGFFIICAIFGFDAGLARAMGVNALVPVLLATGVLFVSILVHELGHALTARSFGWPPSIVLYHFGGLAYYTPHYGYTSTRSVLISLAGPGAGFVLYGITLGVEHLLIQRGVQFTFIMIYIFATMKFVNLWWGLVNLLPVYPLDGGRVAEQVCKRIDPYRGMEYTFKLGIVAALGAALAFYYYRRPDNLLAAYPALLFLFLAFNNYQLMQQYSGRGGPW
jgi:Zn-dependent protease